jgi:phage/plasmid-like protein (TIGR03299 family)
MMQAIDISKCAVSWDAVKKANLDYKVTTENLVTQSGLDTGLIATVANTNRKSNRKFIGAVSKSYSVTQNVDVFSFADDLMKQSTSLKFDSAGILNDGARSFMALQFPNREILGDEYGSQLIIINSFDGKSGIKIAYLPKRICCSNMINMSFAKASERWSIRHSCKSDERLVEAVASIRNADFFWTIMKDEFEAMAEKKINFDKFLIDFLPKPDENSSKIIKERDFQIRGKIFDIYNNKNDLQNFNGTAYKAYQTIADYVSNSEPLRKTDSFEERRFISFLDGNSLLLKAQELLAA